MPNTDRPGRAWSSQYRRTLLSLAVLAAVVGLQACSLATRFAYNHADWLVQREIEKFVELTAQQEASFEHWFAQQWAWHRSTQLPDYARFLRSAAVAVAGPLSTEQIAAFMQQLDAFGELVETRIAAGVIDFCAELNPDQVQELAQSLVESEQEFYEDYVQAPEAERRQDTAKRMRGTLRKRYGRLSDAQEKLVADWAQQRRDLAPLWHQRQQQWRAQWLLLLEERQSADFAERAEQLLFNSERDWPAELQQGAAENLRLWNQLLSDVHNISSDKQRQSLAQQLLDYAEDAEALSPT